MVRNKAKKLEIGTARTFSESFKKQKVRELTQKQISIAALCSLYNISRTSLEHQYTSGYINTHPIINKRLN